MTDLITTDLVRLDAALGHDKHEVIRALARIAGDAGRTSDVETLTADALAREETSSTGMPGGIAIPHCRTEAVTEPTLVFARLAPAVDFGAKDGAADLAFLICAPAQGGRTHLKILTQLARSLVKKDFVDGLRAAESPEAAVALIQDVVTLPAEGEQKAAATTAAAVPDQAAPAEQRVRRLVAVTACPTGIAHTYMAAEALEAAAGRAGVQIDVETQGSAGSKPLPAATIAAADAVVFAVDVGVRDRARFAGKPLVSAGVKRAIDDGDAMIREAVAAADDPSARRVEGGGDAGAAGTAASGGGESESWGAKTRRILMTGVSYMIPFVAAGGLLIALGFLFGGYEITGPGVDIATGNSLFNLPDVEELGLDHALFGSSLMAYFGALFFALGAAAFGFLVPALAGYIAFAIADRPGIAPGFVMGAIAGTLQTGFLGGIVGGVLAGIVAKWMTGWRTPAWARGLMPVLVIPLGATLITGFVMVVLLGRPLGALMSALTDGLNSMTGTSAILLGVILGLMMAFDLGGPLNKVAYAFATTGLATAATSTDAPQLKIMAAVMLAGMVPPLAMALATVIRPRLFNQAERENGKAAWLLGASFISEGAIPFAAADPLRVLPAVMLGSGVTGGLSQALDVGLRAPHGGIFVLPFAVDGILGFLIALTVGTLVAAFAVVALKSLGRGAAAEAQATAAKVETREPATV